MGNKQKTQIETVDVTISLPKPVLEFLRAHEKNLSFPSIKKYIEDSFLQTVQGDIENGVFEREAKMMIDAILKDSEAALEIRKLRVTTEVYERLKGYADSKGLTVPQYIHKLVETNDLANVKIK